MLLNFLLMALSNHVFLGRVTRTTYVMTHGAVVMTTRSSIGPTAITLRFGLFFVVVFRLNRGFRLHTTTTVEIIQ